MVLLDSTAPKPGPAAPIGNDSNNLISRATVMISSVAHFGVGRLIAQSSYSTLPPRARDEARANASTARNLASFLKEFLVETNTSMQQASTLTSLHGKPLVVLTADKGSTDNQWQSKQAQMAKLSTNSVHRHANATHDSLISDAADSAAASQAIRDVVAAVRTSHPLS